jgi:hypothetical protein
MTIHEHLNVAVAIGFYSSLGRHDVVREILRRAGEREALDRILEDIERTPVACSAEDVDRAGEELEAERFDGLS